jgi:hypothetical protein
LEKVLLTDRFALLQKTCSSRAANFYYMTTAKNAKYTLSRPFAISDNSFRAILEQQRSR